MKQHYLSGQCSEPKTRPITGLLDRLEADEFVWIPSLGDIGEKSTAVTTHIEDSTWRLDEAISPDLIDHCRPEHLVASLEIVFVDMIREESRRHVARRELFRGNAVDCSLELAHPPPLDRCQNA